MYIQVYLPEFGNQVLMVWHNSVLVEPLLWHNIFVGKTDMVEHSAGAFLFDDNPGFSIKKASLFCKYLSFWCRLVSLSQKLASFVCFTYIFNCSRETPPNKSFGCSSVLIKSIVYNSDPIQGQSFPSLTLEYLGLFFPKILLHQIYELSPFIVSLTTFSSFSV